MWIEAELVLSSYKPLKLEKGMMFIKWYSVNDNGGPVVFELDYNKSFHSDAESYMLKYGCPVEASLYELSMEHPLSNQLATSNEIAWVDEGEDSEDMHEITIEDFNVILKNKMRCQVKVNCNSNVQNDWKLPMYIPVFDEEKIIIRLIEEEE